MKIATDHVNAQADRMLGNGFLKSSPRQRRFFEFVLAECLAGRERQLKQETITSAIGQPSSGVAPANEASLRVCAGRVRRSLLQYFEGPGREDAIRIVMPMGSYVLTFHENRAGEFPGSFSNPRRGGRSSARFPSVAIEEFRGLGLKGAWKLFPALLAEELSVSLGSVTDLRVVGPIYRPESPTSESSGAGAGRPVRTDFRIEGSMTSVAGAHSLHVRLLEGDSGIHLWSRRYDWRGKGNPVAGLESDLMRELTHELGFPLGIFDQLISEIGRVKDSSFAVFEAVLIARLFFRDWSPDAYRIGVEALERAIATAPEEAVPRATLSLMHSGAWNESFSTESRPKGAIDREARRAMALDPRSSWANMALICAAAVHGRDAELADLVAALESDPSFPKAVRGMAGLWLIYRKVDLKSGRGLILGAMEGNPRYPRLWHLPLAMASLAEESWAEAGREIGMFRPSSHWCVHLIRAVAAARSGRQKQAAASWKRLIGVFPDFPQRGHRQCKRSWHPDHAALLVRSLRDAGFPVMMDAMPSPRDAPPKTARKKRKTHKD